MVPHRASLINFHEEATTCCLIIASYRGRRATEPTLFFLYFPRLVCTPRKSMPSPPLHRPRYRGSKSLVTAFIHFAARKSTGSSSPPFRTKPIPIDRDRQYIARRTIRKFDNVHFRFCHFVRCPWSACVTCYSLPIQ